MIKRWTLGAVVLLVGAMTVRADSGWGVYGSYWKAGDWGSLPGVGAHVAIEVVPHLLLDFRGAWYDKATLRLDNGADAELSCYPLEAGLLLETGGRWLSVYGGGGVGYYILDGIVSQDGGTPWDVSIDDKAGAYGLVGLDVALWHGGPDHATRITCFVEGLYRYVKIEDATVDEQVAFSTGEKLSGFGGNAGLRLRW